jgi:hypothetical protein
VPQTQEVRLPDVVSNRLLEIADYQRPYAWGKKQLEDLWEDLDLLGPTGTHYAGTLVLRDIPSEDGSTKTSMGDDGETLRHCEVVDGQQRLTTCLLLLDRIRRALEALEHDGAEAAGAVARRIRTTYGLVSVDNALVPKLKLGAGLNAYWVDVVLGEQAFVGPALIAGQQRLKEAVAFFDAKLSAVTKDVPAEVQLTRLKELQRRVTAGLGFLVYEVRSAAEVGVIFETLNERGRDLTDLEKTKNYLLYLARSIPDARSAQLADQINEAWASIFTNLAREAGDADEQLLRAHWLATVNPDRNAWKRIASIKARFDRSNYVSGSARLIPSGRAGKDQAEAWDELFDEVGDYVRTLRDCSFFLSEMFDPQAAMDAFGTDRKKVLLRSGALARSGVVALYRPLLFAARLRHPDDGAFYAELVDLCERYSARVFVIEQRRTNAGEPRLLRLAHDLYSGADPQHVLGEVRAVLWRYAPDERVRETLQSTAENWYVRRGHKYFLYEYERSLLAPHEELPPLSSFTDAAKEQRTTEHILPQNPKADADCWWDHFSEQQHAELCHALGNLALTLDNSAYGRKCFADKRGVSLGPGQHSETCYAQGKLHQEKELALYDEWTPSTIRDRQARLAEWALSRWAVSPPGAQELREQDVDIENEGTVDDELVLAGSAEA